MSHSSGNLLKSVVNHFVAQPEMSPLTNGRELKPAVELKVVVEENTKHLMKVENRLIPRRDSPPCGFKSSSKPSKMSPELITVHNTCAS